MLRERKAPGPRRLSPDWWLEPHAVLAGLSNTRVKTVAIIGASNDRRKYGNKAVRAYLQQGYSVYPVNPNELQIENLPVFKSIRDAMALS
jgi:predicted CoA-binding protein